MVNASGIVGGDRVLNVQTSASLTIRDLTITGGDEHVGGPLSAGGGIRTDGSLAVIDSRA